MRNLLAALLFPALLLAQACGGAEPEAEATWETHTVAPDESAPDEDDAALDETAETAETSGDETAEPAPE